MSNKNGQKLAGKIAVITGGNSGIGLATAKRFVEEGAHVVITGRREKELKEAAALIGRNVTTVVGDVTRLEDLDRLFAVVKEKHGHIDVLFANAGWGEVAPLETATEAHFDKTFDLNVKGTFFTAQKALPLFKDGGSIILTSSVANVRGDSAFSAYAASKAAVRCFARGWTAELKDRKIRVNSMSPGPIETPALENAGLTAEQVEQVAAQFASEVPLGRRGKAEEVAAGMGPVHPEDFRAGNPNVWIHAEARNAHIKDTARPLTRRALSPCPSLRLLISHFYLRNVRPPRTSKPNASSISATACHE